jgi:hypothetical protein
MKLARYRIAAGGRDRERSLSVPAMGAAWVQFGDEVVVYADDADWSGLTARAASANLALEEQPAHVARERLHLVVQKGRLFQRAHPDVPIILDKGRYLLVDLDPGQATELNVGEVPCYTVRPLEDNFVAFDVRQPPAVRAAAIPWVQDLVDRVSLATFQADLEHLVAFPTRLSPTSHYDEASRFAEETFSAMGYEARRESITVGANSSHNVIATKPGTLGTTDLILVTAHLDSINGEDGAAGLAPGADDDGSGSAGVLEIARALKDRSGLHDLEFVLFGGEEQGLHGSRQYVAALDTATRARIRAVVNMDMIASLNTPTPPVTPTVTPTVLLEGATVSQAVIDGLAEAAATYTGLTVETSLNPHDSDHVSFIDADIPAVLTIEGADAVNEHVHTARDTLDRINFALALEVLRMNTAFVATSVGSV